MSTSGIIQIDLNALELKIEEIANRKMKEYLDENFGTKSKFMEEHRICDTKTLAKILGIGKQQISNRKEDFLPIPGLKKQNQYDLKHIRTLYPTQVDRYYQMLMMDYLG